MISEIVRQLGAAQARFQTADVVRAVGDKYSRQHVSATLSRMLANGDLSRYGAGKYTCYSLVTSSAANRNAIVRSFSTSSIDEDQVVDQVTHHLKAAIGAPENVVSIANYAFSEMLNNAIDHSGSKNIDIVVMQENGALVITVTDHGVGVFRNIKHQRGLESELDAVQDLLKGKTTTLPQAHSGEGIFFTSKAVNLFVLESFDCRLRIDNDLPDIFVEQVKPAIRGTKVSFTIDEKTRLTLSQVFERYQSDPEEFAFDKTEVQVRLYTRGTIYVSRSQAKRVLAGLDKFKVILLDFDRVPTVGQGFADEIFRVFAYAHPDIELRPVNMAQGVSFMVKRAINTVR